MRVAVFWVRKGWRKLISMRTALVLLFLLAVASVPGSLLPQRPLNPTNVTQYLADHGAWGHFLDTLGFFDVFGSVWFAAIYLLLFVSLIGCLVPRIRVHVRALRTKPLPAPKHLTRLPESSSFETTGATADVAATAADQGQQMDLVEDTIPIVLLTVGGLLVAAGVVGLVLRTRKAHRS